MSEKFTYTKPFGNSVSRTAVSSAQLEYRICRAKFGTDLLPVIPAAAPAGEVYDDFGVLTVVDRNRLPDGISDEEAAAPVAETAGNHTLRHLQELLTRNSRHQVQSKAKKIDTQNALIIGTIRMGFGHWRMAIAIASAAHKLGYTPYLLDLMSFSGTVAQKSIRYLESCYNRLSRISQSSRWFNKYIWEKVTSHSTLQSCIQERSISRLFMPVFQNLPKDIPLLSMHPWVGHSAVMCGMKNVVSIIPDNLPLAFWLVEGSRHTVQSPSAYTGYRTLVNMEAGHEITSVLPENAICETGHYVDYELVSSIEKDCKKRMERCAAKKARRFLLTMGGAGAQVQRFAEILEYCVDDVKNDRAVFFVNMGDHAGRWTELQHRLDKKGIQYELHTEWETTKKFVKKAYTSDVHGIHIFLHSDFYAAVYLTNLLMHDTDIMITKPSELSFYPVPKLFIQRVGRHEAWGAIRGAEIGDGTMETATVRSLRNTLKTLINSNDLLSLYIGHILENKKNGIYDGAMNAVKYAMEKK